MAVFSPPVGLADQLTLARIAAVPVVLLLLELDFEGHDYWATGVFAVAMTTD
jgi:phosphatidylglycerophosphate synthase